jgi:hypothetical protein
MLTITVAGVLPSYSCAHTARGVVLSPADIYAQLLMCLLHIVHPLHASFLDLNNNIPMLRPAPQQFV